MSATFDSGFVLYDQYIIQKTVKSLDSQQIYLAEDQRKSNEKCSVLRLIANDEEEAARVFDENYQKLTSLFKLRHLQLQAPRNFFQENRNLYIVQDSIEGDLCYEHYSKQGFCELDAVSILRELLFVLKYLHSQGECHGNITPNSIYIRVHDRKPVLTNLAVLKLVKKSLGISISDEYFSQQISLIYPPHISKLATDIYDLATTIIIFLTNKSLFQLIDKDSIQLCWEPFISLSNEFTEILNQMLCRQNRFIDIQDIDILISKLGKLNTAQTPISSNATTAYTAKESQNTSAISLPSAFSKYHNSKWIIALLAGLGFTFVGMIAVLISSTTGDIQNPVAETTPSVGEEDIEIEQLQPQSNILTEQKALELVEGWLQAKQKAFAAPFQLESVYRYTTGEYRDGRLGAINWLREKNAYYVFHSSKVEPTGVFWHEGNKAMIEVKVTEDSSLYVNNQRDSGHSGFSQKVYRYILSIDSDSWKISNSEEVN